MHGFIDDIRHRRNIDVYVTIVAAATLSILSLFDVVKQEKITPLLLTILAIMAFNMIATRNIVISSQRQAQPVLHSDFAPELMQLRSSSLDIYLIGVSLSRTIEHCYGDFSRSLAMGGRIRILLTDPRSGDAALDARCQSTRPSIEQIRLEIRQSLDTLSRLHQLAGGALEVRLTSSALKFGMNYLDTEKTTAIMHVQLYSYRLSGESRPMLVLRPSDHEWFDCYKSQAEALWIEAEVFDLGSSL